MAVLQRASVNEAVTAIYEELAQTASERDRLGGTAKTQRDFIRHSGLLALTAPEQVGGLGSGWTAVLAITRKLAQVDSSMAHLFGYHFLCLASVELYGSAQQVAFYTKETVEHSLFWGNAFNPRDTHVVATQTADSWVIQGMKSFCSGAKDSDRLLISAQKADGSGPLIAVIPTNRKGVEVRDDWDSFGQRQTDSGSVHFEQVIVYQDEVLQAYEQQENVFSTVRTHVAQSILTHVLIGTAEGAFDQAKQYTKTVTRPWLTAHVESASEDPYYIHHYGELYVQLKAADALVKEAVAVLESTWQQKHAVTVEQRGECSIVVAIAKIQVAKTALDVTSRVFELMGARATSAKYNFDRYWRNIRTHTLHDPIDYKIRDVGQYVLNEKYPEISAYS